MVGNANWIKLVHKQTNGPHGWAWLFVNAMTLSFHLALDIFSLMFVHQVDHPPSFSSWVYSTFRSKGDPPFSLFSRWERIIFNDVIWDAFASIMRDLLAGPAWDTIPVHIPSIPHGALVGAGSLWNKASQIKKFESFKIRLGRTH